MIQCLELLQFDNNMYNIYDISPCWLLIYANNR